MRMLFHLKPWTTLPWQFTGDNSVLNLFRDMNDYISLKVVFLSCNLFGVRCRWKITYHVISLHIRQCFQPVCCVTEFCDALNFGVRLRIYWPSTKCDYCFEVLFSFFLCHPVRICYCIFFTSCCIGTFYIFTSHFRTRSDILLPCIRGMYRLQSY